MSAKHVEGVEPAGGDGQRPVAHTHFVIVTGLSGAGKSQAAKCLEDLGYFCVDNLPPSLIPKFAELCSNSRNLRKVALVLDIRGEEIFGDDLAEQLRSLDRERIAHRVIFLDAADDVLVRRFSETRRKHPLAGRGGAKGARLVDSIVAEREELKSIRDTADVIIDTSKLTLSALKEKLGHAVAGDQQVESMTASVVAFGFKFGIPLDADMVFDVRFLPNPNYVDELQPLTGSHPSVAAFLENSEEVQSFKSELFRFVDYLVPRFVREGKAHLTIGIGCTGGRHRSVYFANELAAHLRAARIEAFVEYRDVQR
ncbi:MAG TPA: RNase adapter RapZ [Candidatus Eremiobacteraceae bacterium]